MKLEGFGVACGFGRTLVSMEKIKQIKLFEGETLKELEQELNGFYFSNNCPIISSKFLSFKPYVFQIVYLVDVEDGSL